MSRPFPALSPPKPESNSPLVRDQVRTVELLGRMFTCRGYRGRMALPEPSIAATESFAAEMHAGQLDKAGEEYIGHPLRVRATVERTAPAAGVDSVRAQLAALLHDVVEDTDVTLADLVARGYSASVVAAVDALSKRPDEQTETYLARVATDPIAVVVKHADMADNSDPVRLGRLPAEQAERLAARYVGRRAMLDDLVTRAANPPAADR